MVTTVTPRSVQTSSLTSFRPDTSVSEELRVWAAATLADLPTRILFKHTEKNRVSEETDSQGHVMRQAFAIVADPEVHQEFRLYLFSGATHDDLDKAQDLIRKAKSGWFNSDIWKRREGLKNWLHRSFWTRETGLHYRDELRPCEFDDCIEDFHQYMNGDFNDRHFHDGVCEDFYSIELTNFEDPKGWRAFIQFYPEVPEGPAGLKVLRDAANDYAWLQQQADHLNDRLEVEANERPRNKCSTRYLTCSPGPHP